MPEENHSYDRQVGETDKAWQAFILYRDMGIGRTMSKVCAEIGRQAGYVRQLERWSSQYSWVKRCEDYDRDKDKLDRLIIQHRQREEHIRAIRKYQADANEIGNKLVEQGKVIMAINQQVLLDLYRSPKKVMTLTELQGMAKAAIQSIEFGRQLIGDSIGIDEVMKILDHQVSLDGELAVSVD